MECWCAGEEVNFLGARATARAEKLKLASAFALSAFLGRAGDVSAALQAAVLQAAAPPAEDPAKDVAKDAAKDVATDAAKNAGEAAKADAVKELTHRRHLGLRMTALMLCCAGSRVVCVRARSLPHPLLLPSRQRPYF